MHPVAKPSSAPRPAAKERPIKVIARNPRARHDYEILHTYEAGIVLQGTEVKTLRQGRGSIVGAFGRLRGGEVWLEGIHIPPYAQGNIHNHEPLRSRKLLMHRRQIDSLVGAVERKGRTIVPLAMYWKNGRAKLEVGLARGKKEHDKRADTRERDWQREKARVMKGRR